jgi:LysM repeat protein
MKNLILLLLLSPLFSFAQKTHTVAAKESLFSIGRLYNIHPRELAAYNNIPFEVGLTIGQVLKIPAKANLPMPTTPAPVQATEKPTPKVATGTPIYHKVGKKETLYHISTLYNKVPIADLKKWNSLDSDALKEGMNLIVGYSGGTEPATPAVVKQSEESKPVITKQPAVNNPKAPEIRDVISNPVTGKKFDGGVFKAIFNKQNSAGKEERGKAGIFKSTSGWEDGKYYCLHNSAQPGTIIKITHVVTNKSVYAKVLDVIPDMEQNKQLMLRLSNAAADELGAGAASTFECVISY